MTQKRFLLIFANLVATSDDEAPLDTIVYWKIQSIINVILQTCKVFEPDKHNSIDEQMIPFQGCAPCCQYVRIKRNPVKLVFWTGRLGIVFWFRVLSGKNTVISAEYKKLGLGGSVVKCWVENLPQNENFKVYFDNSYTGIPLLAELNTKGFCLLGVLKTNRMEGAVLMSKSEMKKRS